MPFIQKFKDFKTFFIDENLAVKLTSINLECKNKRVLVYSILARKLLLCFSVFECVFVSAIIFVHAQCIL